MDITIIFFCLAVFLAIVIYFACKAMEKKRTDQAVLKQGETAFLSKDNIRATITLSEISKKRVTLYIRVNFNNKEVYHNENLTVDAYADGVLMMADALNKKVDWTHRLNGKIQKNNRKVEFFLH
ncbi:MAG TPA: hypothetical protein VJK25_00330 [Patescibacteria group bacterium]|nr:hypothetical protein [Patescibacteria group bacterium]